MTLSFKVFGIEVALLELDLGEPDPIAVSPLDSAAKSVSNWFFKRMIR